MPRSVQNLREVVHPPRRLAFDQQGQQYSSVGVQLSRAKMNSRNEQKAVPSSSVGVSRGSVPAPPQTPLSTMSVAELEVKLEQQRELFKGATAKRAEAEAIIGSFEGLDLDKLNEDQKCRFEDADAAFKIAEAVVDGTQQKIREAQAVLEWKAKYDGVDQRNTTSSAKEPVGILKPKRTMSVVSSRVSSARRKAEMEMQRQLLETQKNYNREMDQLELEILKLEESVATQPDEEEKKSLNKTIELKKNRIAFITRSFDRKRQEIEDQYKLDLSIAADDDSEEERRKIMEESESDEELPMGAEDKTTPNGTKGGVQSHPYRAFRPEASSTPYTSRRASGRNQRPENNSMDFGSQLAALGKAIVCATNKTPLPMFNGKHSEWPVFQKAFESTRNHYDDTENANRLSKAVQGVAREAVYGIIGDPFNVDKVMKTLKKQFGSDELVLDSIVQDLRDIKPVEASKPESFVRFSNVVQHLVARAKSLNKANYLYNNMLLKEIVGKLPIPSAEDWLRWVRSKEIKEPNLAHFGDWIEEEADIKIPLCKPVKLKESTEERSNKSSLKRGSAVHVSTTVDEKPTTNKSCCICDKEGHKSSSCFKLTKEKDVQKRRKIAEEKKLCFICLKSGHQSKKCSSDYQCPINGCGKKHNKLLHLDELPLATEPRRINSPVADVSNQETAGESAQSTSAAVVQHSNLEVKTCAATSQSKPLSILPVKIYGPKGIRRTYLLQDSGCNGTMVNQSLATQVGLTGEKFQHTYKGVGGIVHTETAEWVDFGVSGDYRNAKKYDVTGAVTVSDLKLGPYTIDVDAIKAKYPYLRKAKLRNLKNVIPEVIVGEDNPFLTAHREILERGEGEPMAKRTHLGWVLGGKLKGEMRRCSTIHSIFTVCNRDNLDAMIKESFSLASFGVVPRETSGSVQDKRALHIMDSTTNQVGDRWECGLLWKRDNVQLPPSRQQAYNRMISNEKKMRKNEEYSKLFHSKIQELLDKDYIRKVTQEELNHQHPRSWYLPLFGVFNPNKPGKILVLDAASTSNETSLNDNLLSGPDLIRNIVAVLWNFRVHNIVITGDVEEMFHRVKIIPDDQNAQRFLWRKISDADHGVEPETYAMNVMIFGATSSPASAIFVMNKNAKQYEDKYPNAVRAILKDFYVDDCLTGAKTVDDAIRLREQICEVNGSGGFMTKKWISNSPEVIASIPEDYRAEGAKSFNMKSVIPSERVLGLWYNPNEDTLNFKASFGKIPAELFEGRRPTKREVCSLVMSIYDPIGFLINFKIKGLVIMQRIWRSGIDWDDEIPDSILDQWQQWVTTVQKIGDVHIPRMYCKNIDEADSIQLHMFVDASEEAFAAVGYLRVKHGEHVSVSFVGSKARVAPLKKPTIPRLELLAAVMGARLAVAIQSELSVPITERYFWSDSKTVLLWIRSETLRYKEFVANRVGEIQDITNTSEWRWIGTSLNVADEATRLNSDIELSSDSRWLVGPEFLKLDKDDWPKDKVANGKKDQDENNEDLELKTSVFHVMMAP